jgi:hypothetical protein
MREIANDKNPVANASTRQRPVSEFFIGTEAQP